MNISEEKRMQKRFVMSMGLRQLLAFMSGIFSTLLFLFLYNMSAANSLIGIGLLVMALLAPLCIGIVAPLTVDKRSPSLIVSGLGMSLLVLVGIAICGLIAAKQADAAWETYCNSPGIECHIGSIATPFTLLYLAYGVILTLPSALLTGLILKKRRVKQEGRREGKDA